MLLIAYGTRPEWLKVKPIIEELERKKLNYRTIFTGQHKDLVSTKPNYEFKIPEEIIGISRLNLVLSECIRQASIYITLSSTKITHVMVQGDTTSALGVALAAYNLGINVIHLEAGLRTHDLDNPFPEEANRQLIGRIASIHFCPTTNNESNLSHEWIGGEKFIVGNTSLDNLVKYNNECEYENKILITLHRHENHSIIYDWFIELDKIAKKYSDHKFILPIHPNPNVQKYSGVLNNVTVIDPLSHEDLINILIKSKFVITDSGGIQEEASFFRKKAIVCRKTTERPEALSRTSLLCEEPKELMGMASEMMENYEDVTMHECPFGDGTSAKKIVKILKEKKIV